MIYLDCTLRYIYILHIPVRLTVFMVALGPNMSVLCPTKMVIPGAIFIHSKDSKEGRIALCLVEIRAIHLNQQPSGELT